MAKKHAPLSSYSYNYTVSEATKHATTASSETVKTWIRVCTPQNCILSLHPIDRHPGLCASQSNKQW